MSYALLTGSEPSPDSLIELIVATPGSPLWSSFIARFAYSTSPADGLIAPAPPCCIACWAASCDFLMLSINPIWTSSPRGECVGARTLSGHLSGTLAGLDRGSTRRSQTLDAAQLKRIPLFADASDDELKRVALFAESREIPEGQVVIEEGEYSRELLAIEDGEAEVTRNGEHIAYLGPGDIFGEAGMLSDEMRSATVTAKTRLRVISLRHFEVKRLQKDAPDVYARIERLVEERASS